MDSASIRKLIDSLRDGNMKSYETLFDRYYMKIKGFARKLIKDEWAAEEIAQNVFLKLWINREKLMPDTQLEAYLFSIARNEVVDHFRSKQRFAKFQTQLKTPVSEEQTSTYDTERIRRIVKQMVESMPEQRQRIFKMSRIQGVTNEEIARQLGISKRTVEKHISLALEQLRSALGCFVFWLFLFFISY